MAKKLISLSTEICTTSESVAIDLSPYERAPSSLTSRGTISLSELLDTISANVLDQVHPIGSLYISRNSTHPNDLFGGEWEPYSSARTLLGSGEYLDESGSTTYSLGDTGGSLTHTLTIDELPSHTHRLRYQTKYAYAGSSKFDYGRGTSGSYLKTTSVGKDQPHNNVQPYDIVYIWVRIS